MQKGIGQAELARAAQVSRQALSAIEAGRHQPSVQIALRLAQALDHSVESLFGDARSRTLKAILPANRMPPRIGTRVALAKVGGRLVGIPLETASLSLVPAAGLIAEAPSEGTAAVSSFWSDREIGSTLLIAGCDPSIAFVAEWFARKAKHINLIASLQTSYGAMDYVIQGRAHACGVHLCDARTGEFNLSLIRRRLRNLPVRIVNFAHWEVGLAARPGDRFGIRSVADLGKKGIQIVNRQPGSGARIMLDELLKKSGIDTRAIRGYDTQARGHLEVAAAIAEGAADAGVTLRVAAEAFRLSFFTIREEQYDLVIPEREFHTQPIQILLDALNSTALATEIRELCHYDTKAMGGAVARLN